MDDNNSNLYLSLEHAEDEMEDEDDFQQRQIAVLGALVFVGAEESRRERLARRQARRTYLIRGDLLPNPRADTPWQALYMGQNDRAFITTMGVDVPTFDHLLSTGF